jgi:hypothetical protein
MTPQNLCTPTTRCSSVPLPPKPSRLPDEVIQRNHVAGSKPAASASEPTAYQSQDQQKHDGSNEGIDDQGNHAYSEVDTKLRQ